MKKIAKSIELIRRRYEKSDEPWIVGYSGGKDSSCLLKLVFAALSETNRTGRQVHIVYCDTGVEIPVVVSHVRKTLKRYREESRAASLPIYTHIARPKLSDRYFVKVIGRGYPPPTNIFRWCTDRLRTNPVHTLINSLTDRKRIVLLGIRKGESPQRDRTISKHVSRDKFSFRQSGYADTTLFCPMIDFSTDDVWETLTNSAPPRAVDGFALANLYRQASGECPIVKDSTGTPCGKGRFGCWTCTVVRKDHAVRNLIEQGYSELRPLAEFRDWLAEIRDHTSMRMPTRRNGTKGPGPFTLDARREILRRLLYAQRKANLKLILDSEIRAIKRQWDMDRLLGQTVR